MFSQTFGAACTQLAACSCLFVLGSVYTGKKHTQLSFGDVCAHFSVGCLFSLRVELFQSHTADCDTYMNVELLNVENTKKFDIDHSVDPLSIF